MRADKQHALFSLLTLGIQDARFDGAIYLFQMLFEGIGKDRGALIVDSHEEEPLTFRWVFHGLDCFFRWRSNRRLWQAILRVGIPRVNFLAVLDSCRQLHIFQAVINRRVVLSAHRLIKAVEDTASNLIEVSIWSCTFYQRSRRQQLIRSNADGAGTLFNTGLVIPRGGTG